VLTVDRRRVCAVRLYTDHWKLLIVCLCMPYDEGESKTDDFIDQLRCIEHLINSNADCNVAVSGDCNVDFTR